MPKVEVRLFGAFRVYTDSPSIGFEVPAGITVAELKPLIVEQLRALNPDLQKTDLVYDSAIANEREILSDSDLIGGACALAILPPVCGG